MRPLAERVALAHRFDRNDGMNIWCSCGSDFDLQFDLAAHIATVTEWVVRDDIARDIERLTPNIHGSGAFCAGMDRAARIAKGD